jgi:hypothetical protein
MIPVYLLVLGRKLGQVLLQVQGVDASGLKTTTDGGRVIILQKPSKEVKELLKETRKQNAGRYKYCYIPCTSNSTSTSTHLLRVSALGAVVTQALFFHLLKIFLHFLFIQRTLKRLEAEGDE